MTFTQLCNKVFNMAINDYHVKDDVDTVINNPYDRDSIENSGIWKTLSATHISTLWRL